MTMVLAPHRGAKTRAKAAQQAEAPRGQAASKEADVSQKN
jgi:translation initiation factor IF-3